MTAFAAPQLCLQSQQQVFTLLFVELDVEVARNAECVLPHHLHLREQRLGVPKDQVLQSDESATCTLGWRAHQTWQHRRHLH